MDGVNADGSSRRFSHEGERKDDAAIAGYLHAYADRLMEGRFRELCKVLPSDLQEQIQRLGERAHSIAEKLTMPRDGYRRAARALCDSLASRPENAEDIAEDLQRIVDILGKNDRDLLRAYIEDVRSLRDDFHHLRDAVRTSDAAHDDVDAAHRVADALDRADVYLEAVYLRARRQSVRSADGEHV